jgi:hypothetical protein
MGKYFWDIDHNIVGSEWAKLQLQDWAVPFPEYKDRPVEFLFDKLNFVCTKEQADICNSVRDNRVTNVQASHGVGKTAISARLALWYLFAVGGQVVTTAPTFRQVKNLIWKEIRSTHSRFSQILGGTCNTLDLFVNPSVFAIGFSSSDHNTDAFQGMHADYFLFIQDEANGISPLVDDGFISCATGENNRILRVGNPVCPYTPFYYSCQQSSTRLSCWGHPNVSWAYQVGPDGTHRLKPDIAVQIISPQGDVKPQDEWPAELPRDLIPGAVSISWIEGIRKSRGEGTAYWLGRVEGIFPVDSTDSLFPIATLHRIRDKSISSRSELLELHKNKSLSVGLDCGDGGDDSAISILRGHLVVHCELLPTVGDGYDGDRLSARTKELQAEYGEFGAVAYDASGVGSWLDGPLKSWFKGRVHRIKWGEAASKKQDYGNLKAEQFDELAKLLKGDDFEGGFLCSEESWNALLKEFASITRRDVRDGSKMYLVSKKELREKLGHSPDLLDSLVLAYSIPLGITSGKVGSRDWIAATRKSR